jgi:hypothetical protein
MRQEPQAVESAEARYQQALALADDSACARSRPTATAASARCTPRPARQSRPALRCPPPSIAPWT